MVSKNQNKNLLGISYLQLTKQATMIANHLLKEYDITQDKVIALIHSF
jgi:hypothetical protein